MDLDPEKVLQKKEEDIKNANDSKTLDGISSKFEYICQVKIGYIFFLILNFYYSLMELYCGEGSPVSVWLVPLESGRTVV